MINPYHKYQESAVQTATPGQLIIMLYDGAIKFVKQGILEANEHRFSSANLYFQKAQSILHELVAALDPSVTLSKELNVIYEYLLHLLIQANIKKDMANAEEAIIHLNELREAWRQAIKQSGSQTVGVN